RNCNASASSCYRFRKVFHRMKEVASVRVTPGLPTPDATPVVRAERRDLHRQEIPMRIRNAGVVVVAALALAAAGCGDGDTTDNTGDQKLGGSLVIWADDKRAAALKPFAEQFGTDNGVTVEVKAVSED